MEADSVHSTVERMVEKRVINVPSEYIDVSHARKNPRTYAVMFLDHTFFK